MMYCLLQFNFFLKSLIKSKNRRLIFTVKFIMIQNSLFQKNSLRVTNRSIYIFEIQKPVVHGFFFKRSAQKQPTMMKSSQSTATWHVLENDL